MPQKGKPWSRKQREKYKNTINGRKPVEIVNVSGVPQSAEEWQKGDKGLATQTAAWLARQGAVVAISTTDDGAIMLDYALNDRIQPTIKVESGKLVWPKGTDFRLMMAFLRG